MGSQGGRFTTEFSINPPLRRPSPPLEGLAGSKVFSCRLDASQAYHHLSLHPACTEMTAFICAFGLFEFLRMPFGYYREFLPQFSRLTADMNSMKAKRKWEVGDWDSRLAGQFQELKDLFCLEGGPCRARFLWT